MSTKKDAGKISQNDAVAMIKAAAAKQAQAAPQQAPQGQAFDPQEGSVG